MVNEIFREYDIRGEYPSLINEDVAYKIGRSYGSYIKEKYNQKKCVVSMDNRLSSPSLKSYLIKGILESGIDVIDYGLTTTPMNFFARMVNNCYGIMITASHNPKDDNGFKFSFGGPSNAKGKEIENFKIYTFNNKFLSGNGTCTTDDIFLKYKNYISSGLNFGDKQIKVIVDPGNGAASSFVRNIFSDYNIDLIVINEESDGNFPSHHPDPAVKSNLEQLRSSVLTYNADLGIAYDGDGDRIGFVKNNGEFMSTEEFMIVMMRDINFKVANRTFLYDVKCSKILEEEIKKLSAKAFLYRTGASYTQSKVHEENIPFGGEFSGHIFFRDKINDCGSAIYASLRLVEFLSKTDKSISEITSDIPKYFITEEIKIPTSDDKKFMVVENVKRHCLEKKFPIVEIDGVKVLFKEGWALIRASNTGPNIIFRAEADTEEYMIKLENYFTKIINECKEKRI